MFFYMTLKDNNTQDGSTHRRRDGVGDKALHAVKLGLFLGRGNDAREGRGARPPVHPVTVLVNVHPVALRYSQAGGP